MLTDNEASLLMIAVMVVALIVTLAGLRYITSDMQKWDEESKDIERWLEQGEDHGK
ncbi:hypothetical protein [Mariprofundus ferrooxydans]|uniref:Uncharacterized protein n=1 Tax=Mariprofundus ferrooxydans PV-1 TaxID=314345 RepID=Q0EWB4_9PROT|nr:hypothetical protein [Mariprofundus ferrooxydans]EAU53557.1 hypothetical protein SPV1_02928 [Mariprofundus ferrooxydans PV-1]